MSLASLNRRAGELPASYESAKSALAVAKEFDVSSLIAMSVETFAPIARRIERADEAISAVDHALSCHEQSSAFDLMRSSLLTHRAAARLDAGDHVGAKRDLSEAHNYLSRVSSFYADVENAPPGFQWRIGNWWYIEAKRRTAIGRWTQACEAWQTALGAKRSAVAFWRANRWESDAAIKLSMVEICKIVAEFAAAADKAGDSTLADSLRRECQ
jgi:hypothetical protein